MFEHTKENLRQYDSPPCSSTRLLAYNFTRQLPTDQQVCCPTCFEYVSQKVAQKHLQVCAGFEGFQQLSESQLNQKLKNFRASFAVASALASDLFTQMLSTDSQTIASLLQSNSFHRVSPSYAENLKELLTVKLEVLANKERQRLSKLKSKLEVLRHKQPRSKKLLFREKPGLNLCIGKIESITNQVAYKCGSSVQHTASSVFDTSPFEGFEDFEENAHDFDEASQESNFCSLCLSIKMTFSSTHPAQTVPISGLYVKALRRGLASETWADFIQSELSNPANWVRQVRGPRKTVKSRLGLAFEEMKEQ